MNRNEILWDSNTVIYYLQKLFPSNADLFIDNLLITELPALSLITEIEILCWRTAAAEDLQIIQNFITSSFVIELEPNTKQKTAELRRKYRIKLPDAIIAAIALVYDLVLLTRNITDFKNIDGLKLINPWKQ